MFNLTLTILQGISGIIYVKYAHDTNFLAA